MKTLINDIKDWFTDMDIWRAVITIIFGYFFLSCFMVVLTIVKAICLHFFNYQLTFFGTPV